MNANSACPDTTRWQALLDGTLAAERQAELTEHLDRCAACQHALEELVSGAASWAEMAQRLRSESGTEPVGPRLQQVIDQFQQAGQDEPTRTAIDSDCRTVQVPTTAPGRLGAYELHGELGSGGMGQVLKGFDAGLRRFVAIKVMAPELATSATARQRFLREARTAAAVRHVHVVGLHAVEENAGLPYLVMEYVEGESLQQRLARLGRLPLLDIVRIGQQMAAGLAAAHAQGLVHRDIKPSNILLARRDDGSECVKIVDFGLARAVDEASLTQSGFIAGTPMYMAPEQARGEAVDHRADLFSLGSVLYILCTGKAPFRSGPAVAILKRVCDDTPQPIRELVPEIPKWLTVLIARLHAKDPAARYQTAAEVADLLEEHLQRLEHPADFPEPALHPDDASGEPPPPPLRTGKRKLALVTLLLFAVAATGGLVWLGTRPAGSVAQEDGGLPKPAAAQDPQSPFVVREPHDAKERHFPSLEDAVRKAQSGDTVEIRGDGPFLVDPIEIDDKALIIRAGKGCWPVIKLKGTHASYHTLLATNAPLVLEGLELQHLYKGVGRNGALVRSSGAPVLMANCRLLALGPANGVRADGASHLEVRNCLGLGDTLACLNLVRPTDARLIVDRNVFAYGGLGLLVNAPDRPIPKVLVRLTRNTWFTGGGIYFFPGPETPPPQEAVEADRTKPVHIEAESNIFACSIYALHLRNMHSKDPAGLLRRLVEWTDRHNLYATDKYWSQFSPGAPSITEITTLDQWRRFWGKPADDSVAGRVGFQGGDLSNKSLGSLVPGDFRLHADSPGWRAGKDNRDLGVDDLDLVGPGPAYERWKKTPEYEQWLRSIQLLTNKA